MSNRRVTTEMVESAQYPGTTYPRQTVEVKCCGTWLNVSNRFTTTCDSCEADYNQSGHRLAPRSQWGEETGEHWSECY